MKLKHNYLDLVEEYGKQTPINQFEKVLVLTSRAKDLYAGKTCRVDGLDGRKPTTMAQYEILNDLIEPTISDKVPGEDNHFDDFEEEDL